MCSEVGGPAKGMSVLSYILGELLTAMRLTVTFLARGTLGLTSALVMLMDLLMERMLIRMSSLCVAMKMAPMMRTSMRVAMTILNV